MKNGKTAERLITYPGPLPPGASRWGGRGGTTHALPRASGGEEFGHHAGPALCGAEPGEHYYRGPRALPVDCPACLGLMQRGGGA